MEYIAIKNDDSGLILNPAMVKVTNADLNAGSEGEVSISKCEQLECYISDQDDMNTLILGENHWHISNFKESDDKFTFTITLSNPDLELELEGHWK